MRIIAGSLKSRQFNSPPGSRTHPMSEKMRGALFSALGDISGLNVLDAFAGSGAVGFEAISRGAASVLAIESDKRAQQTILANKLALGVERQYILIKGKAVSWSKNNSGRGFDVVICDPPYNKVDEAGIERLARHTKTGGIAVFSLPPATRIILPKSEFSHLSAKSYGDSNLVFYRKVK